jgi:hypothetical protein
MKHETLTTEIENITPSLAKVYLETNTANRKLRDNDIHRYASAMRAGHWGLSHQGIAFDQDGVLKDGQHRLHAVVMSGKTVPMMVTKGLPPTFGTNGSRINVMDVLDCGRGRSVSDQLHLSHGINNQNLIASAAATMAQICCGSGMREKLSTPQALKVIDFYGEAFAQYHKLTFVFKPGKLASVVAALAFADAVHPNLTKDFALQFTSGVGLRTGDPALALRNWITNGGHRKMFSGLNAASKRIGLADVTLNTVHHFKGGEKVQNIRPGTFGREYFIKNQRPAVETIKAMFITSSVAV